MNLADKTDDNAPFGICAHRGAIRLIVVASNTPEGCEMDDIHRK